MRGRIGRTDDGAYAVLYALLVVVLVLLVGVVVELGAMREDRRTEKLAADAAATAGALKLNTLQTAASPRAACEEAWTFLRSNLGGSGGPSCSGYPTTTPSTCPTIATEQSGTITRLDDPDVSWGITITWPVPNSHALMTTPNVTGKDDAGADYSQPIDSAVDGADPCARLGVSVSRTRNFAFASVGGFVSGATLNSSVARADLQSSQTAEFPLVVLDQSACNVVTAAGSGPAEALIRILNNGNVPGRLAVDSKATLSGGGSTSCSAGNRYAADTNGGAKIVAYNGADGTPALFLSAASALTKAADPSDVCSTGTNPATVATGICPPPTAYPQITRKFWDWRYHCTSTTTPPLSAPCPYSTPDYIGQIRAQYSASVLTAANAVSRGFTLIGGVQCSSNAPYRYFAPGNYYVNCPTFDVNRTTVFGGGVVVFSGDVAASGSGGGPYCLVFNQPVGASPTLVGGAYPFCAPTSSSVTPAPTSDMTVYLQKGTLSRQNSDFIAPRTFFYQEADLAFGGNPSARIDLGAGTSGGAGVSGTLLMTAPTTGPFEDLTLWSENRATSTAPNAIGAQSKLALEGILFLPNGQVTFSGQPTYLGRAKAQFVAWRLSVGGGSTLDLFPDKERTLGIPLAGIRLIR